MMAQIWKDLFEFLPPLLLLFFLAFSPGIMRFLQKRILQYEEKKKGLAEKPAEEMAPKEEPALFTEQSQTMRIVSDSDRVNSYGMTGSERSTLNPAMKRLDELPPLQKAVIWAEILGPPGGKSEN